MVPVTDQIGLGSIKGKYAIKYLILRASRRTRTANLQAPGAHTYVFGDNCWKRHCSVLRTTAGSLCCWDFPSLLVLGKVGKQPRYLTTQWSWHSNYKPVIHSWFMFFLYYNRLSPQVDSRDIYSQRCASAQQGKWCLLDTWALKPKQIIAWILMMLFIYHFLHFQPFG